MILERIKFIEWDRTGDEIRLTPKGRRAKKTGLERAIVKELAEILLDRMNKEFLSGKPVLEREDLKNMLTEELDLELDDDRIDKVIERLQKEGMIEKHEEP
jgi:hypothetical protein